ncbi:glutathione S-transferase omega-1-like isoform X1 [Anomaloglossus baeobatrachus]|uniref:glutathione S-transferase omega-1-like isoform X1 n=1 Tax=Anomaloglossus baeobatrachus TaxID=238106 RepID=UPI003F4FF167
MTTKKNEDTTELKAKIFEKFKIFEETLIKRNSPYIGGESVSMIDYMVWTWFERHQILDTTEVLEKMPHINAWYKCMLQDPAVKKTFTKPELFTGFFQLYIKDSVDAADYGLN